ncbi:hypothetical protein DL96DRAFT_1825416 [Flagelloscypha sp. PMI_526]|nr:hypothetical protein DL96DRAFT_1825416 [Flagelloscypha sp. PMI_526]
MQRHFGTVNALKNVSAMTFDTLVVSCAMKFSAIVVFSVLASALAAPAPALPGLDSSVGRRDELLIHPPLTSRSPLKKIAGSAMKVAKVVN